MEVVDDGVDEAVAAAGVGGVRELVQSVSKSKEIKQNLITIHEYVKAINWILLQSHVLCFSQFPLYSHRVQYKSPFGVTV